MQRQEQYKNLIKLGLNALLLGMLIGIWAYFWTAEYARIILRPFGYKGNWLVFMVYGIMLFFFISLYEGYRIGYFRREDIVLSGVIAIIFTNSITYLQTCLVGRAIMRASPFLMMTAVDILAFWLWATVAGYIYIKAFPPQVMLLVYGGNLSATNLVQKMSRRSEKYMIEQAVSIDIGEDEVKVKILKYSSVIICDVPAKKRNHLIKFCFDNNIRTYVTPKISDILLRSAEEITIFDTPLLLNRNYGLSLEQRFLKRLMDIFFSAAMLVLASPFMLITAVAIKIQDGGKIIFKQARATIDNKTFNIYKFRSMIEDAEKDGKPQPASDFDSRITPVGRFIRKTRVDELPQLWNILIGDMSIVGPRAERLEHVEKYTAEIPEFSYRLKVRAGLTGYAQVIGKYNTSAYDKLKMDLMYISGYSLILDLKIMFMTLKILFKSESTEGM